jgi:hypothetical protein
MPEPPIPIFLQELRSCSLIFAGFYTFTSGLARSPRPRDHKTPKRSSITKSPQQKKHFFNLSQKHKKKGTREPLQNTSTLLSNLKPKNS